MTELREMVAATMAAAEGHAYSNDCPMVQRAFRQHADAAIEAIFAALQSDEAVERAASAIHGVDKGVFPGYVRHIPSRKVYLDRARAALQAAALTPSPATREEEGQ